MTRKQLYAHPGWKSCTFEGAEMSTLRLGMQTTFREKLEWLEEAETLTLRLRASRENRKAEGEGRTTESKVKNRTLKTVEQRSNKDTK